MFIKCKKLVSLMGLQNKKTRSSILYLCLLYQTKSQFSDAARRGRREVSLVTITMASSRKRKRTNRNETLHRTLCVTEAIVGKTKWARRSHGK